MIRILHVIPRLEVGGAELFLCQLASGLAQYGFESRVLALEEGGSLKKDFEQKGITVHELTRRPRILLPWKLRRYARSSETSWQPDLIQGWMYHSNLAALVLQRSLTSNPPVLWNIRMAHTGLNTEKRLTSAVVRVGGLLSHRAQAIIYNSLSAAHLHEQRYSYSSVHRCFIPNGFDTELWTPSQIPRANLRQELGLPESALLVGMISRYHPSKNHAGFLRAAAQIRNEFPDVHFVLAGSGVEDENPQLLQALRELKLLSSVHLLGLRRDVPAITAALDVLVSPSHMEGFPNVVGEAMACGIPCVVTDTGDSASLLGNAGLVVPPADESALVAACLDLLRLSHEQRASIGYQGRSRIVSQYSSAACTAKYSASYSELLPRNNTKNRIQELR